MDRGAPIMQINLGKYLSAEESNTDKLINTEFNQQLLLINRNLKAF